MKKKINKQREWGKNRYHNLFEEDQKECQKNLNEAKKLLWNIRKEAFKNK